MGEGRRQPTRAPLRWRGGEDRRQEKWIMSEELVEYFIPQFFWNNSPVNPNFLVGQAEFARLF